MNVPSEREALIRLKSIYEEYLINIKLRIEEIDKHDKGSDIL
jgi:hypothetical protein